MLLDYIKDGVNPEQIVKSMNSVFDPTKYCMQQALPTDGQVAVAEKLIFEKGYSESLKRVFATRDDIHLVS